ncbi:IclR family transcriptional regulator [Allosediminivita pacifica]|uniref:IclR family transcriptional regulator n=1 Tax=Allosediminivita pacifica TaxID=1267769 RepID=A0A2T6AFX9_9RHOB|nr:helix-turn-helix domain-containing protein [Allosediminivita pacifica]PTX42733.1 IclR family transcriptional regulator [Allosediminivita pacifica]GGB06534.1 IclR family transcriptional regulator [Allosediminivita pacifica]
MTSRTTSGERFESLEKEATGQHRLTGHIPEPAPGPEKSLVPALHKGIRLLRCLNSAKTPLTLAELAQRVDISKSHCHGLLKTLTHFDWLRFDPATHTYELHHGISRDLSSMMRQQLGHTSLRPFMEEFTALTGVSCVLSEPLADHSFLVLDQVSASDDIEISYPSGYRLPPDATAHMRAYLGWQREFEIDSWFSIATLKAYTGKTASGANDARMAIRATRERGYARSMGEFTDGIMAMALPVFGQDGRVRYIFDCVGRVETVAPREEHIAGVLVDCVTRIHDLFGSILPPDFPRARSSQDATA